MNKIAVYLNEHLLGEVSGAKTLRKLYATDGSILSITPEIVALPRVTNDIRKIARFAWQLAEKGHAVGVVVRGAGCNATGAAIGKGIVVDTAQHLHGILQVAPKEKLVHVQAGARLKLIHETLRWQGLTVAGTAGEGGMATVGGVIADDAHGEGGSLADAIERLEVVLANGDLIETGRMSRREMSKKLGLQTLEGEIYRKLEGLIEDNESTIAELAGDPTRDNTGFKRLSEVRGKDGSFDLTPLFIGSQGTLGIISEVVLKVDFYSAASTYAAVAVDSMQTARDVAERLAELEPFELLIYDGELFRRALKYGAHFAALGDVSQVGAVVFVQFNDISDRAQSAKLKKMRKLMAKATIGMVDSTERPVEDFHAITIVARTAQFAGEDDQAMLPILNGASVPSGRQEEFESLVAGLATKHHIKLPLSLNVLEATYNVYPALKLSSVSDKQKLFKLLNEYAATVDKCGGAFTANGAEGRLKASAAWSVLDDSQAALYEQLRLIFDPFGTLNPGVKQKNELRSLVAALRTDYGVASALSEL